MPKIYFLLLLLFFSTVAIAQTTISIVADRDNTIYSSFPGNSNGAGQYIFVGRNTGNNESSMQRALLHFDLSAIPPGAIITSATLSVFVGKSAIVATGIELHKMTANWGEGTSDAESQEGSGAPATTNDATWTQRIFPSTAWASPGGDFATGISASVATIAAGISSPTQIQLTGAGVITDLQNWVADPPSNFGWIIKSNNETAERSAKRMISRNSASAASRPTLSVTYNSTLAVTLKGFSASITKQDAILKWSTANEIGNDHFDIEHSTNGKDFTVVGQVNADRSASIERSYSYLHENISLGKHFYRIADVDRSGNKHFSQILTLTYGANPTLQLYPNPVPAFITITSTTLLQGNEYSITSAAGSTVQKGTLRNQQIDVQNLSSGQYWLIIRTKQGEVLKTQFLKK